MCLEGTVYLLLDHVTTFKNKNIWICFDEDLSLLCGTLWKEFGDLI